MASVQAIFDFKLQVIETPDMDQDLAPDPAITHEITGDSGDLSGSSAEPPITKKFAGNVVLAAGAKTLDLTALENGNLPNETFDGLKVQILKFKALPDNTNAVKIKKGGTNGYEFCGSGAPECTLEKAGDVAMYKFNDSLADVSSTVKNLDFSGTGSDGVKVILCAG